jgi:hypothetical protein
MPSKSLSNKSKKAVCAPSSSKSLTSTSSHKMTSMSKGVLKLSTCHSLATTSLITIIYNILVFTYIVNLENKLCNCINDWRHDFIKYFSLVAVIWGLITLLFSSNKEMCDFILVMQNLLMIAALVNIYCLYTYIGDLDKTNCQCAVSKQRNMHYFLYVWRYVLVGTLILSLISVIVANLSSL